MSRKRKPAYLLHKATGQARVRIGGKDRYLGAYGSPESKARYEEIVTEWLLRHTDRPKSQLTVDELALLYLEHARSYYVKNGKQTSEVYNVRLALRPLVKLFGQTRISDFGPKKLTAVRDAMIAQGCVRTSINRQVERIKRMFGWGVASELVHPDIDMALRRVPGLRLGRSAARESEPVKPAPEAFVNAVRSFVSRQVWAMIELQMLTAARPGEVRLMRGCNLQMTGHVWEYQPESHKTEHHNRDRLIFLGPRAQAIVREFLKPDLQAYLFSPADAKAELQARRRENRKTPMTPSQRARQPMRKPQRKPGDCYTVYSYRQAVVKACEKADIPPWHPNQLRHNAATELRREFGIEAARTVLGHASAVTSKIYAEMDMGKARDIIARVG